MPTTTPYINPTSILTYFPPASKLPNLSALVNLLLPFTIIGAALIFLIMALYGAFTWLTAGSESKNLDNAQKIFTYSIMGFVIVIASYVLVKLIGVILGIKLPL